jgi:hypothetical protein
MRFETVNFNIFEENLEDIVYGRERASLEMHKTNEPERKTERLVQKVDEIVIRPLNDRRFDGERERK